MNDGTDACGYSVHEVLRDGEPIRIRSITPKDRDRLQDHFHSLSAHSVYTRFFRAKKDLTSGELSYYTEMDGEERVGLVATFGTGGDEKIVGVGRYFRGEKAEDRHRAEVAFAVSDEHQHRGFASLLLRHLARIARRHGITEFTAEVLGENRQMMEVFVGSGFRTGRSFDEGVFHVTLRLDEVDEAESETV